MKERIVKTSIIIVMIISVLMAHIVLLASDMISYAFYDTGKENVQFSVYFETEEGEKLPSIEKAINSEDIKLCMKIEVKEEGYLNGRIELKNDNFKFQQEEIEGVEKITDQEIFLKQIGGKEKLEIQVGIQPDLKDTIQLEDFNQDSLVVLKGIYTNAVQNRSEIEIEEKFKVVLTNPYQEENLELNAQVITNKVYEINGQNKRMIQLQVTNKLQGDGYPIQRTQLELKAPEEIEEVRVEDRGTLATNGKEEGEFQYGSNENCLTINILNQEEEGKISYNKGKEDTFIITYLYKEERDLKDQEIKVRNKITLYDNQETNIETERCVPIQEEKENVIDYQMINQSELYKGKIYAGEEEKYQSISKIDIRYPKIEDRINIIEGNSYYQATEEENGMPANSVFQKTILRKEQLLKLLGEQGELILKKVDGSEMKKIGAEDLAKEEENIIVSYDEPQKEIIIEINHAQSTGVIEIIHEKAIYPEYKSTDEIKKMTRLVTEGRLEQTNQIETKQAQAVIALQETQTKAEMEINNTKWETGKTNENIEIKTTLVTNESSYDLYKNPSIEVEFPEKVQDIEIKNVSVLYGDGLAKEREEIYENEEGKKVAKIQLVGEQTGYTQSQLVKGANVILNCNVTVDSVEQDEEHQVKVKYTNDKEVQYYNEGMEAIGVNYVATEQAKEQIKERLAEESQATNSVMIYKSIEAGDNKDIYIGQIQRYTIKVRNNTDQPIHNVRIKDEIPNELVYCKQPTNRGFDNNYEEDESMTQYLSEEIETLNSQEEKEVYYFARVKPTDENIGKKVGTKATILIGEEETQYESNLVENVIKDSKLQIDMVTRVDAQYEYMVGSTIGYKIVVKNIAKEDLKNVVVNSKIADGTSYVEGCNMNYNSEGKYYYIGDDVKVEDLDSGEEVEDEEEIEDIEDEEDEEDVKDENKAQYNKATRMVEWSIGDLKQGEEKAVYLAIKFEEKSKEIIAIPMQVRAQAEGTESYWSNVESVKQGASAKCSIMMRTNLEDKYVMEGSEFEYILTVKNEEKQSRLVLNIKDALPEEVRLKEIICIEKGEEKRIKKNAVNMACAIEAEQEIIIKILVKAKELPNGVQQVETKNKATVGEVTMGTIESNEVTVIITRDPNRPLDDPQGEGPNGSDIENRYSISGTAWIDDNKNGIKDKEESTLSGIPVMLYNGEGKVEKDQNNNPITTVTDNSGKYTLGNLKNGDYIVAFQYDNRNYVLTEYKKDGVEEEKNSNVVQAKQGDNTVAITDVIRINTRNLENINIGLVPSEKFDLRLDKYITGITVQSATGTKKYSYNNANFTKIELDRKVINNTTLTIEYKIKVTNEGEIEGQAKKIVDYLSPELQFNPQLNKDWYMENGQLINNKLENVIIQPGESKILNLIVTKKMTEDNLGTVTNTAEIMEAYNEKCVGDIDSIPGNKKADEDDMSTVSIIIGLNTGRILLYISFILVIMIIVGIGIYTINKKVIKK